MNRPLLALPVLFLLLVALWPAIPSAASPLQGLVSIGGADTDSSSNAFTSGFDKLPFGSERPAARTDLRLDLQRGSISWNMVADADTRRSSVVDLQEAWIGWNPVPDSPWRIRTRAGAFFPTMSVETGYGQVAWNAERTVSGSAINSWIAEEIRILGAEVTLQWRGALVGSPHTLTTRAGIFGGNDPAGTQMAWRGWHLANRTTGLFQKLRLPDLPVYRWRGALPQQTRDVQLFREIDGRPGIYGSLGYAFEDRFDVEVMRYDNRGDPVSLKNGQYSWRTDFDHVSLRLRLSESTDINAQVMRGRTLMGDVAVDTRFSSWFLLLSHHFAKGTATLRYDDFETHDHDSLPNDPNGENGHAWAIAWAQPLRENWLWLIEAQRIKSVREARALIGESPKQTDSRITAELRWSF